jgi:hypothetical protein
MNISSPATKKNGISAQGNPDLLRAMAEEKGDKSGKQLSTLEIITQDAQRNGFNPQQILETIAKLKISNQNIQTAKIGNTVFLLMRTPPSTVEVHTFTVDNPKTMVSHFKLLAKFLKNAGMKQGFTYSDQPMFKQLVERSGMPVKITQTTQQIGNEMKPVYMYTMDL